MRFSCRSLHCAVPEEHLDGGGDDQGAGGGEQRDRLHRRFHRPRTSKSSHHPGQSTISLFLPPLCPSLQFIPPSLFISSSSIGSPPHFPSLGSGQLSIERWAIAARAHPTPDLPTVTQTYGTHAPSRPPTVPSLCHLDLGTWAPGPIPSLRPISHHPTPRL